MGQTDTTEGGARAQANEPPFYRFEDAKGRLHIVDSLDLVPQALRPRAEPVRYEHTPVNGLPTLPALAPWQMFALGVAAAFLIAFLFKRLPGSGRIAWRLALTALVVALLGSVYFGFLRRTTQQKGGLLATPGALINDAKTAVEQMNARLRAQQAELKAIEQAK